MVTVELDDGKLILEMEGLDKLWTLKSRLEIPLAHVRGASYDPTLADVSWKGIREEGTRIPGLITGGTFYQEGKRVFWDVKDAEKTVVIDLVDERYDQLVVEVGDPLAVVDEIQSATW